MIYLIRSINIDIETGEKHDILKIGFTEDSKSDKRFLAYFLHNPYCKLICTIPEGTQIQESQLHREFREIRKEWFSYNEEIIKFFEDNKTVNDLENSLKADFIYVQRDSNKWRMLRSDIKKYFNYYFCNFYKDLDELQEVGKNFNSYLEKYYNLINEKIFKLEDFIDIFSKDNNIEFDLIERYKQFEDQLLNENKELISEFLNKFNNEYKSFISKMKYLCEFIEEQKLEVILDYIPLLYKTYYVSIGPERCKAFGYNKTYLDKELNLQKFDVESLIPEIHNTFKEGEVYSLAEIKEKLKSIYTSFNYNKTAKATDIGGYFEVNNCLKRVEGKMIRCYRIIKKKVDIVD